MHLAAAAPAPWGIRESHRRLVTDLIDAELLSYGPELAGPIARVLSGGKGLRPGLTIAAATQRGQHTPDSEVLRAAAAVEVLHWATLVHDDVIDGATSRHGRLTLNAGEGLPQAVVSGDLLISTVFALGGRVGPAAVLLLTQALADLCLGQAGEERLRYDPSASEGDVIAVLAGKTGSLLSAAAQIGALSAGLAPDVVQALAAFGMAFGISLQLLDDVLDLVSTPDLLGKPVLADFSAGTMTLATVAALRREPHLRDLVRPDLTPAELGRATAMLRSAESLSYAMRRTAEFADRAETALLDATSVVSDARQRNALRELAGWPRLYVQEQLSTKVEGRWLDIVRSVAHHGPVRVRAAV